MVPAAAGGAIFLHSNATLRVESGDLELLEASTLEVPYLCYVW